MKHLYYNKRTRFAQGAAALIAGGVLLGGAMWPRAEAADSEPEQVGFLLITGQTIPQPAAAGSPLYWGGPETVLTLRGVDPALCVGIEAPEEEGPSQSDAARERPLSGPAGQLPPTRGEPSGAAREEDAPEAETQEAAPWWTEEELELLACTIYCEAGSDSISDETRLMVGQVVINRVNSPDYPNTIEEVLTQRGQYGRFHWTGVVWPSRAGRSVEAHAVERAYDCAERVLGGEWLLPTDVIYQAGFVQGREIVAQAPGFYFCR